jgi:mannose-6-phosphate isomerase-like protein (cupin superfamily)
MDHPKATINLIRGGVLGFGIQNVQPNGGETNLHAHAAAESLWFVLKGKARFYDTDDHLFGEYGPNEGIGIPRASAYWFEAGGDENLEIAHVTVVNKNAQNHRLNFSPLKERQVDRHQGTPFRDLAKHHAKPMSPIKYDSPPLDGWPMKVTRLYDGGDMIEFSVEKVDRGGDVGLHAHTGAEGAWYVLGGTARFHGEGGVHLDLPANQGVFIPTNVAYGFESVGDETLEILHIKGRDVRIPESARVDIEPKSRGEAEGEAQFCS